MTYVPEHFKIEELACRCGCGMGMTWAEYDESLLILLDRIRGLLGRPVRITSGYRCATHNAASGGKPNSEHIIGAAADIFVADDDERYDLLVTVLALKVKRVGIARGFIHVGVSRRHPAPRAWIY